MPKRPSVSTVLSGFSSATKLASNFNNVAEAFDNTLSRDGSGPNTMEADLDLNSNRIINLATPVNDSDAARYKDLKDTLAITNGYLSDTLAARDAAQASETSAAESAAASATSAANSQNFYLQSETLFESINSTTLDSINAIIAEYDNAVADFNTAKDTALTNIDTAETTALSAISTAETNAIDSISADVSNAAASAASAAASETNAAASEDNAAASASAASTSAANAATSETNAATSESNAATSETNALTYSNNASSSANSAGLSATAAANSESNAAASASAASTSAANAASSASDAATSAASVASKAEVDFSNITATTDALNEGSSNLYYTNTRADARVQNAAATVAPLVDGTATVGTASLWARQDHVHPTDTSREPALSAGTTSQYYRGDKSWQTLNTTAVSEGANLYYTDTRADARVTAALASTKSVSGAWTFSTAPVVPTQTQGDNSTKAASTAYVDTGLNSKASLSGSIFTGSVFSPAFIVNGASGSYRSLYYQTAGQTKWILTTDTSDNFDIVSFDDAGNPLGNAIAIDRLTQIVYFNVSPVLPLPTLGDNSSKAASTAFVNNNAVSYVNSQTLTTTQQSQARTNIGAILTPSIQPPVSGDATTIYEAGVTLAGSTNTLIMSSGNYVFASRPTGDDNVTIVGFGAKQPGPAYTAGTVDAAALNTSGVSITQLMSLTGNQSNLFLGAYINNTGGSAPSYQKSIIEAHIKQSDVSATGFDRDAVGIEGVAEIVSGNTYGRIFPLHAQGIINSGGDGYCVLLEVGLVNNGSAQPLINQQTSKIGLSVVADGTYDGTAGLLFVGVGSKWETGIYGQASALNTNFIRLDDLFCVTAGGFIGVGTTSPGTAALYRKTAIGDAKIILETADSTAGSFVDFLYTGVAAGSFGLNLSSRNMVVSMAEGVNSSIHTQFVRGGGIIIPQLSSDPASPSEGEMWENTTSHLFKIYLNGAVKTVTVT